MAGNTQRVTLKFDADTSAAKSAINELNTILNSIQSHNKTDFGLNVGLKHAAESAKILQQSLQNAVNVDTGKLDFSLFSKNLKAANTDLESVITRLSAIGTTGQTAVSQLATSLASAQVPVKKLSGMLGNFATTLKNTFKWELSSNIVHGLESAMSTAIGYAQDLNKTLTSIQQVSGQTFADMQRFTVQANNMAKSLATTTKSYADASLIYFQQGDSAELAAKKAEITLKATNSAFTATAQEMSEMLTATWNAYQAGADQLEEYVDIMAALGANTATSLEEIATALQKVASTANTVGVSMDKMSSMIATVSSVTRQAPTTVGTAFNTILNRVSSLKLGETLEDGVNLTKYTAALKTIGINVLDAAGNLREMGTVIEEIGSKWQSLSVSQQAALAQTIGGVRQYTNMMALFENWDQYQKNLNIANNSNGQLQRMQDIYVNSWEGASKKTKAAIEGIYETLIDDKFMIGFQNSLAKTLEIVNDLLKGFGGLPGILLQVALAMNQAFGAKIQTGISNLVMNLGSFTKTVKERGVISSVGAIITGRMPNADQRGQINALKLITNNAKGQIEKNNTNRNNVNALYQKQIDVATAQANLLNGYGPRNTLQVQQMIKANNVQMDAIGAAIQNNQQLQGFMLGSATQTNIFDRLQDTNINLGAMSLNPNERIMQAAYQGYLGNLSLNSNGKMSNGSEILYGALVNQNINRGIDLAMESAAGLDTNASVSTQKQVAATLLNTLKAGGIEAKSADNGGNAMEDFLYRYQAHPISAKNYEEFARDVTKLQESQDWQKRQQVGNRFAEFLSDRARENGASRQNMGEVRGAAHEAAKLKLTQAGLEAEALNPPTEQQLSGWEKAAQSLGKFGKDVATGLLAGAAGFTQMQTAINAFQTDSLAQKASASLNAVTGFIQAAKSGGPWGAAIYAVTAGIGALINHFEQLEKEALEKAKKFNENYTNQVKTVQEKSKSIVAKDNAYDLLQTQYAEGIINQTDFQASLVSTAESLGIQGAAVLALAGNYETLKQQIDSTIEAQENQATKQAKNLFDQGKAELGQLWKAQKEASPLKLVDYNDLDAYLISDILGAFVSDYSYNGRKFGGQDILGGNLKADLQKYLGIELGNNANSLNALTAMLGVQSRSNSWLSGMQDDIILGKNYQELYDVLERMNQLKERAEEIGLDSDFGKWLNGIIGSQGFGDLYALLNNTVGTIHSSEEAYQMAAGRQYLGNQISSAKDYNVEKRIQLVNELLSSDIFGGITADNAGYEHAKELAEQLVDNFIAGLRDGGSTKSAEAKMQGSNYSKALKEAEKFNIKPENLPEAANDVWKYTSSVLVAQQLKDKSEWQNAIVQANAYQTAQSAINYKNAASANSEFSVGSQLETWYDAIATLGGTDQVFGDILKADLNKLGIEAKGELYTKAIEFFTNIFDSDAESTKQIIVQMNQALNEQITELSQQALNGVYEYTFTGMKLHFGLQPDASIEDLAQAYINADEDYKSRMTSGANKNAIEFLLNTYEQIQNLREGLFTEDGFNLPTETLQQVTNDLQKILSLETDINKIDYKDLDQLITALSGSGHSLDEWLGGSDLDRKTIQLDLLNQKIQQLKNTEGSDQTLISIYENQADSLAQTINSIKLDKISNEIERINEQWHEMHDAAENAFSIIQSHVGDLSNISIGDLESLRQNLLDAGIAGEKVAEIISKIKGLSENGSTEDQIWESISVATAAALASVSATDAQLQAYENLVSKATIDEIDASKAVISPDPFVIKGEVDNENKELQNPPPDKMSIEGSVDNKNKQVQNLPDEQVIKASLDNDNKAVDNKPTNEKVDVDLQAAVDGQGQTTIGNMPQSVSLDVILKIAEENGASENELKDLEQQLKDKYGENIPISILPTLTDNPSFNESINNLIGESIKPVSIQFSEQNPKIKDNAIQEATKIVKITYEEVTPVQKYIINDKEEQEKRTLVTGDGTYWSNGSSASLIAIKRDEKFNANLNAFTRSASQYKYGTAATLQRKIQALQSNPNEEGEDPTAFVKEQIDKYKETFNAYTGEFSEIGQMMLAGIGAGLANNKVIQWDVALSGLSGTLLQAFKDALGIQSPSKLTKALAPYLIEGLQVGLQEAIANYTPDVGGLGSKIQEAFAKELQNKINLKKQLFDSWMQEGHHSGDEIKQKYQEIFNWSDDELNQTSKDFMAKLINGDYANWDLTSQEIYAVDQAVKALGITTDDLIEMTENDAATLIDTLQANVDKAFIAIYNQGETTWTNIKEIWKSGLEELYNYDDNLAQKALENYENTFKAFEAARKGLLNGQNIYDALNGDAKQISAFINGLDKKITSSEIMQLLTNPNQSTNLLLFESLRYQQYDPSKNLVGGAQFLNKDENGYVQVNTSWEDYKNNMQTYYNEKITENSNEVVHALAESLNTAFKDGIEGDNFKALSQDQQDLITRYFGSDSRGSWYLRNGEQIQDVLNAFLGDDFLSSLAGGYSNEQEMQEGAAGTLGEQIANTLQAQEQEISEYANAVGYTKEQFKELRNEIAETSGLNVFDPDQAKQLNEITYAAAKYKTGLVELQKISKSTWSSMKKEIKAGTETGKGHVTDLKTTMSKIFNTDIKKITNKFVEDHITQLEKMSKGTEKEIRAAEEVIQDDLVAAVIDADETISDHKLKVDVEGVEADISTVTDFFQNAFDQWDGKEIGFEINANTEGAEASVIGAMNTMLQSGQMTANGIQAALNAIGWEPEIEYVPISWNEAQNAKGEVYTKDSEGNSYSVVAQTELKEGTQYYLPRIKSAHKSGGGGKKPASSSGGGGGGNKTKDKKTDSDKERYHQINRSIAKQNSLMDKNEKLKSRKYGADYEEALIKENKEIEKQIALNKQKYTEAERYAEHDRAELESYGATFDAEGNLNYEAFMDKWNAWYNQKADDFANGLIDEDKWKEEVEDVYEKVMKALENYEEAEDIKLELINDTLDKENQILANNFENITYKVNLKLELNDNDLQRLNFMLKMTEEYYDRQGDAFKYIGDQIGDGVKDLESYITGLDELNEKHAAGLISDKDYGEQSLKYSNDIYSKLSEVEDKMRELRAQYGVALEKANEELEKHTQIMTHAADVGSSYITILGLMGHKLPYSDLEAFYNMQYQANLSNLSIQRQQLDHYESELKYYEDKIAAGQTLSETEQKQYEDLQAIYIETHNSFLSNAQKTLEGLKTMYDESINEIWDNLSKVNAAGHNNINDMAEAYGYWQEQQKQYLATGQQLYEVSKLNRDIEGSIADATTKASKQRLAALQQVINAKSEEGKLTEYNIEMYELQYKMALAMQELEDARNAKSTVRLVRDASGNYGYQYTADADKLDEAEQNYEEVLEQIRKLTAEYADQMAEGFINARTQLEEALRNLKREDFASDEEYMQKRRELIEFYTAQMKYYADQYAEATKDQATNLKSIGNHYKMSQEELMNATKELYNEDVQALIEGQKEYETKLKESLDEADSKWDWYTEEIKTVESTTKLSYENMTKSVKDYNAAVEAAEKAGEKVIETSKAVTEQIHKETAALEAEAEAWQKVIDKSVEYAEKAHKDAEEQANGEETKDGTGNNGNQTGQGNDKFEATWVQEGDKWKYQIGENEYAKGWKQIGDKWYHFDDKGFMEVGWFQDKEDGNKWYYLGPDGAMVTGNYDINGVTHEFASNGEWIREITSGSGNTSGSTSGSNGYRVDYTVTGYDNRGFTVTRTGHGKGSTEAEAKSAAQSLANDKAGDLASPSITYKDPVAYLRGGLIDFTGPAWVDGTQQDPELVLNASDTPNLLAAVQIVRTLSPFILSQLASNAAGMLYSDLYTPGVGSTAQQLEQIVQITAEFPNAVDHNEIEAAFNDLINQTAQYINRK